ncbi:hypothetical protein HS088_TW08G00225 [Tripterygium wilfordii]|uniref:Stress up-regulated Nod 19 n=1 Tax=Tripterygium wilfordii TaxID=458696 RepID=A0A7J7DBB2_TRIWF|nr:uncharacterized protein LOC120003786 [Tripterygium wilfordii]KAF5743640.1 hypothetical protein HS088_TW08G00225 [Tripterygium wilfordii]
MRRSAQEKYCFVVASPVILFSWLFFLRIGNMTRCPAHWLLWSVMPLLAICSRHSQASWITGNEIRSAVYLSPEFTLGPGSVEDRYYFNIDFPRGHIAIKNFNAEVVDEKGNPVPLQETYLHHWVVARYLQRTDLPNPEPNSIQEDRKSGYVSLRNNGVCQNKVLGQYFGLGSETRKTETYIPDPYGIEIGNPDEITDGYEERWLLNVHAIDTRGVEDSLGCTECRCDLYNVTVNKHGQPLRPEYEGGLYCCYDRTQCRLRQGFMGSRRNLYLRYTIKWVDWDSFVVPVKVYIFDITDDRMRLNDSNGLSAPHGCKVEYDVESCSASGVANSKCIDTRRTKVRIPTGGYVIYGVAHQHTGGVGSTLYRKDGQVICNSVPTYGEGEEAGNEAGYIVGMSTCYPEPGSIKISDEETLILESNYNSTRKHTGVMGLFYILVADRTPKHPLFSRLPVQMHRNMNFGSLAWLLAFLGFAIIVAIGVHRRFKNDTEDSYHPITA